MAPDELLDFSVTGTRIAHTAFTWPLWAAASLIEGGCSNDGFADFRDGLILQGRTAFERALTNADSLADLPVVGRMADDDGWLGFESLTNLAVNAWSANGWRTADFWAEQERLLTGLDFITPPGLRWDFDDADATAALLPKLTSLFGRI
jgi:hypothetical protein